MSLGRTLRRFEAQWLEELLETHGWNLTAAARATGMSDHTLRDWIRAHGIVRQPRVRARQAAQTPRPARKPAPVFRRTGPRTWVREP